MNELRWSEEGAPPPPKKSIPTWAWWVGGGCAFLLLVFAVGAFVVISFFKKATDPERQWAEVAQVLPYDERPKDLKLFWGSQVGLDMFVFEDKHGLVVLLMRLPGDEGKSKQQMFDVKQSFSVFGKGGRHSMEPGSIHVQGRDLKVLRFVQEGAQSGAPSGGPPTGTGGSILVDVTPEGSDRAVLLQVTRANGEDTPIPDEQVIEILAPFHVGTQR